MSMATVTTGRKPGRPRRYAPGRINATVRFTPERYAALKAEAEKAGRSVSEEVEYKIEQLSTVMETQRQLQDTLATLNMAFDQIHKLQQQLSAVKQDKKRDDEQLAQIVEDAVTRALRK